MNSTVQILVTGPGMKRIVKFSEGKWITLGVLHSINSDKYTLNNHTEQLTLQQALVRVGAYDE